MKSRLEKERAERVEPFMKGAQVRCSSSLCSNIFPARSWFLQITDHVVPPLFLIRRSCKCWSRSIQNMSSMSTLPWTMRVPWLLQGLLTKTNCTQKRQNFQIWRRSCCSKVLFLSGWTWPLLSRTGFTIKNNLSLDWFNIRVSPWKMVESQTRLRRSRGALYNSNYIQHYLTYTCRTVIL